MDYVTSTFFRERVDYRLFPFSGKYVVVSDVLTSFVITGSKISSESDTKMVGRGSSTHDFLADF